MTSLQERKKITEWVDEAIEQGASKSSACRIIGLSIRTLQRWKPVGVEHVNEDQRPAVPRPEPTNKLSTQERQEIVRLCNQPTYAHLPPSQIVPKLADLGIYLGSESSFYRILKESGQVNHRGRSLAPRTKPKTYIASAPNEVWSWDITLLPQRIRGKYFYLYMIEDIYSRYGVMWEVHEVESGNLAAELIEKAVLRERCYLKRPVLHSDNGGPMKSQTMRVKLQELGITPSHSRPGVSDDNPYVESFFRTLKYCPQWPQKGFESLESARVWVDEFMQWYNHQHQHSKIRFVTPAQRHTGQDATVLKHRHDVYVEAKLKHPERWAGPTRNWAPIGYVALNPNKLLKGGSQIA